MESPFKVTGLDHIVFHVKDLPRAKKFYVDFLGLRSSESVIGSAF